MCVCVCMYVYVCPLQKKSYSFEICNQKIGDLYFLSPNYLHLCSYAPFKES